MIRLAGKGIAHLRINGEQLEYRAGDASLRMMVNEAHCISRDLAGKVPNSNPDSLVIPRAGQKVLAIRLRWLWRRF